MVRGPADHRLHDASLVGEGAVRPVAFGIDQVVGGAGGVGKVVFPVELVHPGTLEIAAVFVAGGEGLSVLIEDLQLLRRGPEMFHIRVQFRKDRSEGRLAAFRPVSARIERAALPHLQLAAPQPAVVHISPAVVIHEHGGVDAVTAGDIIRFSRERTGGIVRYSDADPENAVFVPGREIQVIFSILVRRVRRPHLLADPGHVLHMKGAAVIHAGRVRVIHGKDVIVLHAVLVTVVVILAVVGDIVGRIHVDLPVENMGGGIRCKDMGDQRPALLAHGNTPYDPKDH